MLSKTSRKDVAVNKASDKASDLASDLVSAVADAAEAGREKIAPVVESVAGHLSDAADKASDAAAPHVAKAKETVSEAAAPQVAKAKEAVAEVAAPQIAKAKEATADATDAAAPRVKQAKKAAKQASRQAAKDAADAAAPRVKKARKAAKKAAQQAAKDAARVKASTADRAEAAGLTKEQAHRLFADEWMPRIHETIAATAAAGSSAYAALPQQARDAVETVAPQVAKKRRKKGKVFIALGLLAGAGAVALYLSGQKSGAKNPQVTAPEIEKLDVNPVEDTTSLPVSDDAVGDLEKKVDASVSGSRRGRHAAKE